MDDVGVEDDIPLDDGVVLREPERGMAIFILCWLRVESERFLLTTTAGSSLACLAIQEKGNGS